MISVWVTLWYGLALCLPFTAFALSTFWWRPRLWLHSLPADIGARVLPKTPAEERLTRWLLLPCMLLILPGLSILSTWLASRQLAEVTFLGLLRHLYGVWLVVHLWDLVTIDGGHALLVDPARPPIAGTEGAEGWTDMGFHGRAFIRAILMSLLFVVPAAFLLSLGR